MTLQIGDKAPDFSLPSDESGKIITLSECLGKEVLLFFYPKDNTPGCSKEACDFRDRYDQFTAKNILVFGISKDNEKSHQVFKKKYNLPYTLLIDAKADVCEAYGVVNQKSLFGKTFLGISRSTFLIDQKGIIKGIWRNVKVSGHVESILKTLIK